MAGRGGDGAGDRSHDGLRADPDAVGLVRGVAAFPVQVQVPARTGRGGVRSTG